MGNIDELVKALTSKIEEIDDLNLMAGIDGDMDEEMMQIVEDRKAKRAQLQILKDCVDVLAANLQTLVTRSMDTGTTNFDIDAVESVISETSAMLEMLSNDTELNEPKQKAEMSVEQMDQIVTKSFEEADAVEDMIANVEFHDIQTDEMIEEIGATFESIRVTDVPITASNFDTKDANKRPSNWKDVRMKRILIKEFVYRLEGVPEKTITDSRKALTAEVRV
jgi:uncharacterized protein with von Willebrand factor type A (vWA) domain